MRSYCEPISSVSSSISIHMLNWTYSLIIVMVPIICIMSLIILSNLPFLRSSRSFGLKFSASSVYILIRLSVSRSMATVEVGLSFV